MARITKSLSGDFPLNQDDMYSLEYDLSKVSIFFPEPLEVSVPSLDPVEVGYGFGGLSWSLFHRGEGCTACGRCCTRPWRRVWWWNENEPRPEGLPSTIAKINGKKVKLYYHMKHDGDPMSDCTYLMPLLEDGKPVLEKHGIEMRICGLHGDEDPRTHQDSIGMRNPDLKPTHCSFSPFVAAYRIKTWRGYRYSLSRRLPSRNFRWPKCPIDVYHEVPSEGQFKMDHRNLSRLLESYGKLPGSKMLQGIDIWEAAVEQSLAGTPPMSTIWLEDLPVFAA